MNTKTKFTRFIFALVLALSTLGFSASVALADKPAKSEFTVAGEYDFIDVCTFIVHIDTNLNITETDFFSQDGALVRIKNHITEQDTFTANGKMLVGIPFTFNVELLFDSNGNLTHLYATGVIEKVPLPDGGHFFSAGRVDFAAHGFPEYLLSPDKGNPGNIDGFCEALSS
jgi:hypothetical protein